MLLDASGSMYYAAGKGKPESRFHYAVAGCKQMLSNVKSKDTEKGVKSRFSLILFKGSPEVKLTEGAYCSVCFE